MEGEECNRQGDNQWQKADADVGHSPAVGIDQFFSNKLCYRAANAGADQCNPQSQTTFFRKPARDGLGKSDGQRACAECR